MTEAGVSEAPKRPWTWYLQEKIIVIFFLGFSGGLPFPLVYSTLTLWLNNAGIQKSTISAFAWIGFAYALKFLWSPLVDRLQLPLLTHLFGRRRAWLFLSQLLIAASLVALSLIDPSPATIALFAFVAAAVAVSSATQDMAIDAYRIECAEVEMQGLLAASYQYGYRVAIIVGGAGALYVADFSSWTIAYQAMAACMAIGIVTTLLAREPDVPATAESGRIFDDGFASWFVKAVVGPFADFFRRYGTFAITMLAFIALYRISDYVLGILANPFYDDVGFTKSQIASVAKLYGLWVALFGIAAGGISIAWIGPAKSLILSATLIAATNLFFVYLAHTGPEISALVLTISFDNFAQGFSGTVFIAYLSSLTNVSFTATQYALFSSLSVFIGKLVAGFSGQVQELLGYTGFFIYAAATGIPSIILAIIVVLYTPKERE